MLATLFADTAGHIGGIGAVLEVIPAASGQRGLKRRGPLVVSSGESPNLIGRQVQVAKHRSERLAGIDGFQELLPYLDW
jgi:hypothetical protein